MLTNREIINEAFAEIGLGAYAYNKVAEDYQTGFVRLRGILRQWESEGAAGGFAAGGIDDDSGVPRDAERGVICALAVDLAPQYGKQPSPNTVSASAAGRRNLLRKNATIPQKKTDWNDIPMGAGHKSDRINFVDQDSAITPLEREWE